jgi:twitching motility protein PilT
MKPISELLKMAAAQGASDLHVKVGSPPIARLHGKLLPMGSDRITKEEALQISAEVLSPSQREAFRNTCDLDFAHSVPGLGRFRCNIFIQRGAVGLVFRLIPMKIPTIEELGLPPVLNKLALEERGLILVTGTTGSGKSTTLAAIIDYINTLKTANIVTIEDPIEYLHRDKRGIVNQREIGTDTKSFSVALRAALRQDPDVILVGEMRDIETIETGMTAAETGHLVLSTLHTTDATETINRVISVFPPHQHHQVRVQLASILQGIISMRLVPSKDGKGRVPAVEVLIATSMIKESILDATKTKTIKDAIAQGKIHYGMQTFDQSLIEHFTAGNISFEEALSWASNPEDFKLKVKGISSTAEMSLASGGKVPEEDDGEDKLQVDRFQQ